MNFAALVIFIIATPLWLAAVVPLMTGKFRVNDGTSDGRTRYARNRGTTYTRKHNPKEFWSHVKCALVFAILVTAFGIWVLVTDSHMTSN